MDYVATAPKPTAVEISAGPRAVHRDLRYTDQVAQLFPSQNYPKLAPFQLGLGPAAFVSADFFPGALSGRGIRALLGLTFSYERAFLTSLLFAEGTAYEQRLAIHASELFVGAKGRLPLGPHQLSLAAGYGQARYELVGDEARPVVPDVDYRYVRLDAAARFTLGSPFIGLHAGTRLVTATGAIGQSWFPQARAHCFEAGASAGYAFNSSFELLLAFDWIRYGFDFNPVPADTDPYTRPIAGGAIDQYLVGSLALRYRISG